MLNRTRQGREGLGREAERRLVRETRLARKGGQGVAIRLVLVQEMVNLILLDRWGALEARRQGRVQVRDNLSHLDRKVNREKILIRPAQLADQVLDRGSREARKVLCPRSRRKFPVMIYEVKALGECLRDFAGLPHLLLVVKKACLPAGKVSRFLKAILPAR